METNQELYMYYKYILYMYSFLKTYEKLSCFLLPVFQI